jgi:hypothetical protein
MALSHSPKIVTDGLVMYLDNANLKSYPGSGTTWYDLSKNTVNGTVQGSGSTLTFNEDSISLANSGTTNISFSGLANNYLIGKSATISVWFKLTSNGMSGGNQYLNLSSGTTAYTVNSGCSQFNLGFGASTATVGAAFKSPQNTGYGTYNDASTSLYSVVAGQWNCVAATYDMTAGKLALYVNGAIAAPVVDVATDGFVAGTVNDTSNYLGNHPNTWWNNSSFAAPMVYDRVLTAAEIQQNFNTLRGRYGV